MFRSSFAAVPAILLAATISRAATIDVDVPVTASGVPVAVMGIRLDHAQPDLTYGNLPLATRSQSLTFRLDSALRTVQLVDYGQAFAAPPLPATVSYARGAASITTTVAALSLPAITLAAPSAPIAVDANRAARVPATFSFPGLSGSGSVAISDGIASLVHDWSFSYAPPPPLATTLTVQVAPDWSAVFVLPGGDRDAPLFGPTTGRSAGDVGAIFHDFAVRFSTLRAWEGAVPAPEPAALTLAATGLLARGRGRSRKS